MIWNEALSHQGFCCYTWVVNQATRRGKKIIVSVALLPLALFLIHSWLASFAGARYFDPRHDPQYIYLLNSLLVSTGSYPGHMDHPGATAQAIGALALRAHHPSASSDELRESVLREPEAAGNRVAAWLVGVSSLLMFAAGVTLARSEYGLLGAIVFQAFPLTVASVWGSLPTVSPEFFLLCLSQVFCALLIVTNGPNRIALVGGALLGLMMVTKVTALLFLAVPLVLFRRRPKLMMMSYASVGAVFGLFVVLLYREKIKFYAAYSLGWFWRLATRQGIYGDGAPGIPETGQLLSNLASLSLELPHLFACAFVFGAYLISRRWTRLEDPEKWLVLAAISVGQIVLVSKSGQARYAFPALPAAAAAGFLMIGRPSLLPARAIMKVAAVAIPLLAVTAFGWNRSSQLEFRERTEKVLALLPVGDRFQRVCGRGGSSVDCALHLGNNFSHLEFSPLLERLYPEFLLWDGNSEGKLRGFNGRQTALEDLLKEKEVYFQGRTLLTPTGESMLRGFTATRILAPDDVATLWQIVPEGKR